MIPCPECRGPLAAVEYRGVELDVCPAGHGRWWDRDELRMLVERRGGDALAGLEAELAALPASGAGRPCPRCDRPMELVRPEGGDAPWLDRCPEGHGLWFDPGELAALLEARLEGDALESVRDYLADFLEPSA